MKKLVCIIIVNYNGWNDTLECVNSLNNLNYTNYRIIIVDNNSNKKNLEDELNNLNVDIIFLDENKGFAGANNVGIEFASKYNPDYYLLLNNDTIVDKDFIEPMIKVFENDNKVGIVTGKIFYYNSDILWFGGSHFDEKFGEYKISGIGKKDSEIYNEQQQINYATGCLMMISKNLIKEVGLLNEDYFLYYEDADYCIRTIKKGLKIIYEPQSIIYHKESRSTKKGSDSYYYYIIRNYFYYIKKFNNRIKYKVNKQIILLKDVFRGRIKLMVFLKAYFDFKSNKMGINNKKRR